MLTGSCNCKAIRFTVKPTDRTAACHCGQCRKQSGHHWASGVASEADLTVQGEVKWYASSESAQRGFCPTCGCFLFWKHNDEDIISYSLGVIDGPTGLSIKRHIFVAGKGDYYTIADGIPQQD